MGHIALGNLPRTRRWKQVVELLQDEEATLADLANKSLYAIETGLKNIANDEGLIQTFWTLLRLGDAASEGDFSEQLNKLGLDVPQNPSCFDITSAFYDYIDNLSSKNKKRTDVAEMAASSAVECITAFCTSETRNLFDLEPDEVKKSIGKFSTKTNFSKLSHEFFSRFTYRYLGYLLSRELSNHVGPHNRFKNINNHSEFNDALKLHCRQATRIIDDFSGGWYSKKKYEGTLTQDNTARFIYVAVKKLRSELRRGGEIGQERISYSLQ